MADTRVQLEVEDWVRENWMSRQFNEQFYRKRLRLSTSGFFDFDAVNGSETIAACISTSAAKTSAGKAGMGKLFKLRSDILFLEMAAGLKRKLIILTDKSMYLACGKEVEGGRVPQGVEFWLATIPDEMQIRLIRARTAASKEVTPSKVGELPDEVLLRSKQA